MPALFPAACLASGTVLTNEAFTGRVSRRNDERGAELPAQATLLPSARSVCRLPTGTGPRTAPCSAVSPSAPGPGPAVGGALSSGRPAARGGGSRDPRAPAAPSRRRPADSVLAAASGAEALPSVFVRSSGARVSSGRRNSGALYGRKVVSWGVSCSPPAVPVFLCRRSRPHSFPPSARGRGGRGSGRAGRLRGAAAFHPGPRPCGAAGR